MSRAIQVARALLLLSLLDLQAAHANDEPRREEAKALFEQGTRLLEAKECGRALELFLRSMNLFPSFASTQNAAYCLDELGRADESMEMYQRVLAEYESKLSAEERKEIIERLSELRDKLAEVDVVADVEGARLVVDARDRGLLPRSGPLYLLPGRHELHVLKDGYEPTTAEISVQARETRREVVHLPLLTTAGHLVIRAENKQKTDVFLDGVLVGQTPWEKLVSPGPHLIQLRGEGVVSMPLRQIVLVGQQTVVSLPLHASGPSLRLGASPVSARLVLDGVDLGVGAWRGPLPAHRYTLRATEEGYLPGEANFDASAAEEVLVVLRVDAAHPRWPRLRAVPSLELVAGPLLGSSVGASAEATCAPGCGAGLLRGGVAMLRGGYTLPSRLGFELGVGYLSMRTQLQRKLAGPPGYAYALQDRLTSQGPAVEARISYRHPLPRGLQLELHLGLLGWLSASRNNLGGFAEGNGERVSVAVPGTGSVVRQFVPALWPGAELVFPLGAWHGAVGASGLRFLTEGPVLPQRELAVDLGTVDCASTPASVRCLQGDSRVSEERAFGRALLWSPYLVIRYSFR